MRAFKTYLSCPDAQKLPDVPTDVPWVEQPCEESEIEFLESQGYVVMSDEDYDAYVATVKTTHAAWFAARVVIDMSKTIDKKIQYYASIAPGLIRDLYVSNTMAGISQTQSDQMCDDYADVLMRLKEGLFPTALKRLTYKRPGGFVTQEIIDTWTSKILAAL